MIKRIITLSCLLACFACSNQKDEKNQEEKDLVFDNLIGTWKLADEDQFERWEKNEDGTYSSTAFAVSGTDTSVSEKMKIYKNGDNWNFETIVTGQNKGKAIVFTSTNLTDTLVQFENKTHDFPKIISYCLTSKRSLRAFIAGTSDTIYFNYSKLLEQYVQ